MSALLIFCAVCDTGFCQNKLELLIRGLIILTEITSLTQRLLQDWQSVFTNYRSQSPSRENPRDSPSYAL